jgi:undecaprenyl-diphosphatase
VRTHRSFTLRRTGFPTWGFVELAGKVVEGGTEALDRALLLALRDPNNHLQPRGPAWLEEIMRDLTALAGVGVLTLLTIAAAGYLLLTGKKRAALDVVLSIAGGIVLSSLIKAGFGRPRPDLVPYGSRVYTASFPSGHSMMAAVVYLTLGALFSRLRASVRVKAFALSFSCFSPSWSASVAFTSVCTGQRMSSAGGLWARLGLSFAG